MSNKYTAQEMRETAFALIRDIDFINDNVESLVCDAVRMLRQAADLMEREELKKKFEYTVIAKKHDGEVFLDTEHFGTLEGAMKNAEDSFYDVLRYERREVGEWEEVEER